MRGSFTTFLSSPPRRTPSSLEGTIVATALKTRTVGGEEYIFPERERYFQEYYIVNVDLGYGADLTLTKTQFSCKFSASMRL